LVADTVILSLRRVLVGSWLSWGKRAMSSKSARYVLKLLERVPETGGVNEVIG
jgi:hypothetical protein